MENALLNLNNKLGSNYLSLTQAQESLNIRGISNSIRDFLTPTKKSTPIEFDLYLDPKQVSAIIEDTSSFTSVVIAPTGSGKTRGFIQEAKRLGKKLLFIVPTNALKETLVNNKTYGLTEVTVKDILDKEPVNYATCNYDTATLSLDVNIFSLNHFDLVIIDEVHLILDHMNFRTDVVSRLLRFFLDTPETKVIALTATLSQDARAVFGNTTPLIEFKRAINPVIDIQFVELSIDKDKLKEQKEKMSYVDGLVNLYNLFSDVAIQDNAQLLIIENQSTKNANAIANSLSFELFNSSTNQAKRINEQQLDDAINNGASEEEIAVLREIVDKSAHITELYNGERKARTSMGSSFIDSGINLAVEDGVDTAYVVLDTSLQRVIKPHSLVQGINRFRGVKQIKVFVLYRAEMFSPQVSFLQISKSPLNWVSKMNKELFGMNSIPTAVALVNYFQKTENLLYGNAAHSEYVSLLKNSTLLGSDFTHSFGKLDLVDVFSKYKLKAADSELSALRQVFSSRSKAGSSNLDKFYGIYKSVTKPEFATPKPDDLVIAVSNAFNIEVRLAIRVIKEVLHYNIKLLTDLDIQAGIVLNATKYTDIMNDYYAQTLLKNQTFMVQLNKAVSKLTLGQIDQLIDLDVSNTLPAEHDSSLEKTLTPVISPMLNSVAVKINSVASETLTFDYKQRRNILSKILRIEKQLIVKADGKSVNELRLYGYQPFCPFVAIGNALNPDITVNPDFESIIGGKRFRPSSEVSEMVYLPSKDITEIEIDTQKVNLFNIKAPITFKVGMSMSMLLSHTSNSADKIQALANLKFYDRFELDSFSSILTDLKALETTRRLVAFNGFKFAENSRLKANLEDRPTNLLILDIDASNGKQMSDLHDRLKADNITHFLTTNKNASNMNKYLLVLPTTGVSALNWREASLVFANAYDLTIEKLPATQQMFIYADRTSLYHDGQTMVEFVGLHDFDLSSLAVRFIGDTIKLESREVSVVNSVYTIPQLTEKQKQLNANFKSKNLNTYSKLLATASVVTRNKALSDVFTRMCDKQYHKTDFIELVNKAVSSWGSDSETAKHITLLIQSYPDFNIL